MSKLQHIWSPSLQLSLAVIQHEWIWTSFTLLFFFFTIYSLSLKRTHIKTQFELLLGLISDKLSKKKKKRKLWCCSSENILFSFFSFFAWLFHNQQLNGCFSLSLVFSGGFNLCFLFCPMIIRILRESKSQKALLYIYSMNFMYLCMSIFCCSDKPVFKPPNQNFCWGHFS